MSEPVDDLLFDSDDEALSELTVPEPSTAASSQESSSSQAPVKPAVVVPRSLKGLSTILVHPDQRRNELLHHLGSISYIFTDSISPAHYVIYDSCCALMVTARFHISFPDYIPGRIAALQSKYQLKLLIFVIDYAIYENILKEVTMLCARSGFTLLVAWNCKDAARHVINFRVNAERTPDIIMGVTQQAANNPASSNSNIVNQQSLVDALTSVKSVNRTDATNLLNTFKTMNSLLTATSDMVMLVPGISQTKAQRLHSLFLKPIRRRINDDEE